MTMIGTRSFGVDNVDAPSLLVVDQLRTTFAGARRGIEGVSFTLDRNETLAVVGERAAGKTVLLRSLMGLYGDEATTSGAIRLEGIALDQLNRAELRQRWGNELSLIAANPAGSLHPLQRVGLQISEGLNLHLKLDRGEAAETAIELLAQVGIASPAQRVRSLPFEFSEAERRRIAIAIAVACSPRLLLVDEPTGDLDATIAGQLLDLLARLQDERSMGLVVTAADIGAVTGRSEQLLVLYGGRVAEQGPTASILEHPAMPYTEALRDCVPSLATPPHSPLATLSGPPLTVNTLPRGCAFAPRCAYASDQCHLQAPPLTFSTISPAQSFACWHPRNGHQAGPLAMSSTPTPAAPSGSETEPNP